MIRNEANHFGRTFPQRRTRETARFVGMIEPFYAFAADRRIRTDHTVNAVGNQRIDAAQNFIVFEIGRNFYGDRHVLAIASSFKLLTLLHDPFNQVIEFSLPLKLAKILRVGRGDIDSNIVCGVINLVETLLVI